MKIFPTRNTPSTYRYGGVLLVITIPITTSHEHELDTDSDLVLLKKHPTGKKQIHLIALFSRPSDKKKSLEHLSTS